MKKSIIINFVFALLAAACTHPSNVNRKVAQIESPRTLIQVLNSREKNPSRITRLLFGNNKCYLETISAKTMKREEPLVELSQGSNWPFVAGDETLYHMDVQSVDGIDVLTIRNLVQNRTNTKDNINSVSASVDTTSTPVIQYNCTNGEYITPQSHSELEASGSVVN